ncbi:MAG: LysR family transcriptional regulator [Rhizobiales bacterium]|nr:LysR family transcriptional regulator [Hyphomicrobiales bacterium]
MKFTLAQIEAFQTIVRAGNFRAAAKVLGLSQPSGLRWIPVEPPIPSHQVIICYQLRRAREGLRDLVALTQELVNELRAFKA